MDKKIDHTPELESRLIAVKIDPQDTCAFFSLRENAVVNIKECWYCKYAIFGSENCLKANGLCKFKRS